MGVLQVRIDDELKWQSEEILNEIGIDLSTAVRVFLKKVIMERGIPFDMKIDESSLRFSMTLRKLQKISEENGNSEMTLDEINEEIRLAREERKKREKKGKSGNNEEILRSHRYQRPCIINAQKRFDPRTDHRYDPSWKDCSPAKRRDNLRV